MKRRAAIRNLGVAAASLLVPRTFWARQQQDDQDFVIRSEVTLVLLDVSVKNHDGGFVEGLDKDNFQVFENGVRQTITAFSSKDLPVTVGLLVDESRSMGPKRNEVLRASGLFIAESNPKDEFFVLNFNDTVRRGLPDDILFSDNMDQLRAALDRGVPSGMTAMNDAVVSGLAQVAMGKTSKKALVLISDGGDNASIHPRKEMLDRLERSIATVYAVGLFDVGDPDRDPGILKELAHISGGEAYFPEVASDMQSVCSGIAKEIRRRYTLGYVPPAQNRGDLRRIRVNVSSPGHPHLTARTRTSYRYDESANQASK